MVLNKAHNENSIKIVQLNGGRGSKINAEIREHADREGIDAMLLQEPYTLKKKVISFGQASRIITGNKEGETPWTAIIIFNSRLTVMKIDHLSNKHFTCVLIEKGALAFYLVSAYFQFSHEIQPYLNKLEEILRALKGKKVIIGIDANAESPLWHASNLNARGKLLEDFVAQGNLYVCNEGGNLPTFTGIRGESNIDVTLTTQGAITQIKSWKVMGGWTTSEHNAIYMKIEDTKGKQIIEKRTVPRFQPQKANWEKFDKALRAAITELPQPTGTTRNETITMAKNIRNMLLKVCKGSIPARKTRRVGARWWSPELTKLKRETYRARRRVQREKQMERRTTLREAYRSTKRIYDKTIIETRRKCWKAFVTEGASNPWGFAYKLACDRLKAQTVINSVRGPNGPTIDWRETAEILLDELFAKDDAEEDDFNQRRIRQNMSEMDTRDQGEPPFEADEIGTVIRKMKPKKSPGWDSIEVVVVQRAYAPLKGSLTKLFNMCLSTGIVPNEWKKGIVVTLKKSAEKDPQEPASYRPICLLPVLGKVLEGIIHTRIQGKVEASLSECQFGFRKGKSTEDAIIKIMELQKTSANNYVMSIFLDISGAFNNLWWPDIIHQMKEIGCSGAIIALVRNYLNHREVTIRTESGEVTKEICKGCPQGSLLGPTLWNLVFDGLLKKVERAGNRIIAYADDGAIIIEGNSRNELQEQGQKIINLVDDWCERHKMKLSAGKTVMMMLRGVLDVGRPPTIYLQSKRVKLVSEYKYLGVTLESGSTGIKIGQHVQNISTRCRNMFNSLRKVARRDWGLGYRALKIVYKGLFVSIMTYAAPAWIEMLNEKHKRTMILAQRHALIAVTRSYRTISAEAVQILAGAPPIELEAESRTNYYNIRKGKNLKVGNWMYVPEKDSNSTTGWNRELQQTARRKTQEALIKKWQNKWSNSEKGRATFAFLPNVEQRMRMKWMEVNHYTSQLLSGHGNFKAKLASMRLVEEEDCICGEKDTYEHAILECSRWEEERRELRQKLAKNNQTLRIDENLLQEETFKAFEEFAARVMVRKEEEETGLDP